VASDSARYQKVAKQHAELEEIFFILSQ